MLDISDVSVSPFYLPRDIAIDPVSRVIYCLEDYGVISLMTLDGRDQFTLISGLRKPASLALHLARGLVPLVYGSVVQGCYTVRFFLK